MACATDLQHEVRIPLDEGCICSRHVFLTLIDHGEEIAKASKVPYKRRVLKLRTNMRTSRMSGKHFLQPSASPKQTLPCRLSGNSRSVILNV